jgi:hypothetical protein
MAVDTSDANGEVEFTVPRDSIAYIQGGFYVGGTSFNVTEGVAVVIPDAATADLEDLGIVVTIPDTYTPQGLITASGLTQSTNKLLGRGTAGTGAIEEITLGTNLSLTGTTLNASGGGGGTWGSITGTLSAQLDLQAALDLKAALVSPALTGTPTAPTAAAATNTTQLATTAFVRTEISNLVASAPGALDTLDELAAALGDDANFAATVTTSLAGKASTGAVGSSGLTMATAKILGRATAGTGALEELTPTGTGAPVLATSPTLVTPVLGVASATSLQTSGAGVDIKIGGSTSSFPALKRSGAGVEVRLADDSGYAQLTAGLGSFQSGVSISSSQVLAWGSSSIFGNATTGALTGTFRFTSGGGTTVLNFGGDTSGFPALRRSGTNLIAQLADDSGPTALLKKRLVTAKTGNYSVLATDTETFLTNTGAAGTVNFTLPTAVSGLTFTFYVDVAQTLQVTAGASTTIRIAGSVSGAAGNITNATIGGCVTLVAISTTQWVAEGNPSGTWVVT